MFDSLSTLLVFFSFSFGLGWVGDLNAKVGFKVVCEESILGVHAHGRPTCSGDQFLEWARGEELRFWQYPTPQRCRDTWFQPEKLDWTSHR